MERLTRAAKTFLTGAFKAWIERIQSHVTIRGSFDDAQRRRLGQVAQRCPVHKTLANGVHMVDSVAFE